MLEFVLGFLLGLVFRRFGHGIKNWYHMNEKR